MEKKAPAANVIRIRPFPKVVFYYPTVIFAGILCIVSMFVDIQSYHTLNMIFLLVFSINTLIFAFDFSIMMTIIYSVVLVLGSIIFILMDWMPTIGNAISKFQPGMNWQFYLYFFLFFTAIFIVVFIRTRFNYWDVSHNELFHKTGLLSDTKRINAPNLSYTREIGDMFEFLLLKAGRIKLIPLNDEPYVIETVMNINKVDKRLAEILSKMKVTFETQQHQQMPPQPPQP